MKFITYAIFTIFLFTSTAIFAQIGFTNAYFINNSGQTTQCLIKDMEWKSNPTFFEYKLSEETPVQIATISNVQEFQVENMPKFIRTTVQMDRWDVFSPVTTNRNSEYKEETLFLKELVNGAATLYGYADGSLSTYFYKVGDNPEIRQLIRKNYITIDAVGNKRQFVNYMYKRQLYADMKCDDINENHAKNLNYFETAFVDFFQRYNSCKGEVSTANSPKKLKLHLAARVGIVQNSFELTYPTDIRLNYDFGSKTQVRVGLEAEIILPFNKGKWSLLVEPVYSSFSGKGDQTIFTDDVDYKALDLQFGVRHYMFLNPESKIFLNLGLNYALNLNNGNYYPKRYTTLLKFKPSPQIILGAGYKYKKVSGEVRYLGTQNFLADQIAWDSKFTSFAFVLGYQIF